LKGLISQILKASNTLSFPRYLKAEPAVHIVTISKSLTLLNSGVEITRPLQPFVTLAIPSGYINCEPPRAGGAHQVLNAQRSSDKTRPPLQRLFDFDFEATANEILYSAPASQPLATEDVTRKEIMDEALTDERERISSSRSMHLTYDSFGTLNFR
jgi:hypothetical protein